MVSFETDYRISSSFVNFLWFVWAIDNKDGIIYVIASYFVVEEVHGNR